MMETHTKIKRVRIFKAFKKKSCTYTISAVSSQKSMCNVTGFVQ